MMFNYTDNCINHICVISSTFLSMLSVSILLDYEHYLLLVDVLQYFLMV